MVENLIEVKIDNLLDGVSSADRDGFRFITATCAEIQDGKLEITYHFDKNFEMRNYRITVTREDEIPSISKIYFCSVLVENEMKELFGVKIKDIAIDYGGHFLLSDDELGAPLSKPQIIIEQKGGK